jgi:hypothetical protein
LFDSRSGLLSDGNGGNIRWELIEELHKIQDEEGLRLGNRLRGAHIQWAKQKMKVNLAAQTISASVADAIEFCDLVLEIPAFHDSAPTVKFIRIFDHLFDIFNSRNPYGKHFPLDCTYTEKVIEQAHLDTLHSV